MTDNENAVNLEETERETLAKAFLAKLLKGYPTLDGLAFELADIALAARNLSETPREWGVQREWYLDPTLVHDEAEARSIADGDPKLSIWSRSPEIPASKWTIED